MSHQHVSQGSSSNHINSTQHESQPVPQFQASQGAFQNHSSSQQPDDTQMAQINQLSHTSSAQNADGQAISSLVEGAEDVVMAGDDSQIA